jgi:hypothetical protein
MCALQPRPTNFIASAPCHREFQRQAERYGRQRSSWQAGDEKHKQNEHTSKQASKQVQNYEKRMWISRSGKIDDLAVKI